MPGEWTVTLTIDENPGNVPAPTEGVETPSVPTPKGEGWRVLRVNIEVSPKDRRLQWSEGQQRTLQQWMQQTLWQSSSPLNDLYARMSFLRNFLSLRCFHSIVTSVRSIHSSFSSG